MKKVVIEKIDNVVSIDEVKTSKVYIAVFPTGLCKLHWVGYDVETMLNQYAFTYLAGTICWANGSFKSIKEAIRRTIKKGYTVYEISSKEDLIKCLQEN